MPINGRLYELDGLKPFPVDHGPISSQTYTHNLKNNNLSSQSNNGNNYFNANDPASLLTSSNDPNQVMLSSLIASSGILNSVAANANTNSNWTHKFKQIIRQRLSSFNSG